MKRANVAELKNNLSSYLAYVRKGGRVRVFDRSDPIADLVPLDSAGGHAADSPLSALLKGLERKGIVRRRSTQFDPALLKERLPAAKESVVEALLEDRREGR